MASPKVNTVFAVEYSQAHNMITNHVERHVLLKYLKRVVYRIRHCFLFPFNFSVYGCDSTCSTFWFLWKKGKFGERLVNRIKIQRLFHYLFLSIIPGPLLHFCKPDGASVVSIVVVSRCWRRETFAICVLIFWDSPVNFRQWRSKGIGLTCFCYTISHLYKCGLLSAS